MNEPESTNDVTTDEASAVVSLQTGHAGVDEAMAAINDLGDADLATHVATFEKAHDVLRGALTSPAEEDTSGATAL